ncbi:MAG: ROK family protein [Chlamydiae bacterium]|nr:ROK family protein [Chlamydiota bacterium]MBI3276788.1 ROK family protein [Chlamydiota bacterium]
MNYFLGIDMGGTNLRFGLVDEEGKLKWSSRFPTEAGSPKEEIFGVMKKGIDQGLQEAKVKSYRVKAIGVGVPGCVDFKTGLIYTLVNIPGWENTPLASKIKEVFNLPVFVDNDVNVMALGELFFGAARGARNVICITLGTGVGGGVIVEGNLYRGSSMTAGEVGHIVLEKDGAQCNCGNRGCLERYIGNRYLVERALALYAENAGVKIPEPLSPESLTQAARNGDQVAKAVWKEMANYLGIVLGGLVNFFNPDRIVIGGGVAEAGEFLFGPLEKGLKERSMKIPGNLVQLKKAELGVNAGLIGAATLAMGSKNSLKFKV